MTYWHEKMYNFTDYHAKKNQMTMRYHLILMRMSHIENTGNNQYMQDFVKKENLSTVDRLSICSYSMGKS